MTISKFIKSIPKGFYRTHAIRFLLADDKTKKESVAHWTRCHYENCKSEKDEMIMLSGKILANMFCIQNLLKEMGK